MTPNSANELTTSSIDTSNNSMPPSRPSKQKKGLRPVSPPLSNTRLSRLIYFLVFLTFLGGSYYSYRLLQYKTEVGGWWNLTLGRGPEYVKQQRAKYQPSSSSSSSSTGTSDPLEGGLESQINRLAKTLGMPPNDLARAIAVAVREHVPPASLSSVAAKETGAVVDALLGGAQGKGFEYLKKEQQGGQGEGAQGSTGPEGIVDGVVHGMESFVGMDEP